MKRNNRNELDLKKLYRHDKAHKTIYIDININFYREIYNVWDFSPLANRDLDDDLFEYLEDCAREIPGRYALKIVFHLPREIRDPAKEKKSEISYRNYFNYQLRKLRQSMIRVSRRTVINGVLGITLILIALNLENYLGDNFVLNFLAEGFFIGGWVLFWELFSTLFFKLSGLREQKSILTRLLHCGISYNYIDE